MSVHPNPTLPPHTLVRHGDGLVGAAGPPHVEDDHRRRVVGGRMADLVPVGAVASGDQSHPGGLGGHQEAGVGVTGLSVLGGGGQQHHPPGLPLRGVLPVAATLRPLAAGLGAGRVPVGDVDEGRVPLLPLRHREVQTQQLHTAQRQQPGGQGQAAAG